MRYIAYVDLTAGIRWLVDGEEFDSRVLALLAAIDERGSLKQAVAAVGLSYRHAWALLGRVEERLGQPLVALERGRGAHLTHYGRRLTQTHAQLEARLTPELRRAAASLAQQTAAHTTVKICASHDLALARFAELVNRRALAQVALRFQGSVDALDALARSQCDIAGFHVPAQVGDLPLVYRGALQGRTLRLVLFGERRQGLMLARGNPLRITTLRDLAARRARFVNRQQGSGTRILLDSLLAQARLRPAQIHGYTHEEYTHAALAATVASGAADAAFGIEAAACQQGLAFVPLAHERYFLAARAASWAKPGPRALLHALQSRLLRRALREFAGYQSPRAVELMEPRAALNGGTASAHPVESPGPS